MQKHEKEKIIKEFKHGLWYGYVVARWIGKRLVEVTVFLYKGGRLVFKKSYPTVHKGLVALDNAIEKALRETVHVKVDIPIVKG